MNKIYSPDPLIHQIFITVLFLLFCFLLETPLTNAQSNICNNGDALVVNTGGSKNNQCIPLGQQPAGTGTTMIIPNASVTGTTVNRLAKLTGAPSTALITATSDTENAIGIVTAGAGTTGNATITILGQASCEFDNATVAGDYFIISTITAGMCHDAGNSYPTGGATYGRVLTTNAGAGTFVVELMTPDIAFQNAGNGKSKPGGSNTQVQVNSSSQFGGISGVLSDGTNLTISTVLNFCADAGSSDTYTCSLSPSPGAYGTGQIFWFKANTANTGAATINFNSLGAKTIVKLQGGITTALADNDIRAGQYVGLIYDGTNMQMLSAGGNVSGTSFPLLATDGSQANPSYSWTNATGTGFYLVDGSPDQMKTGVGNKEFSSLYQANNAPVLLLSLNNVSKLGWGNGALGAGIYSPATGFTAVISSEDASPVSGTIYSPANAFDEPGGNLRPLMANGQVRTKTLTSNRTMDNPGGTGGSNTRDGAILTIVLTQDGTGGRTITWASGYKWQNGIEPTMSRTAGAIDRFTFYTDSGNNAYEISRSIQDSPNTAVASDLTSTSTTLGNITGLTANIKTGLNYSFRMIVYAADSLAADGAKFDFDGGTATFSNARIHCTGFDTALVLSTQTTAIATDFALTTVTGDSMFECYGTLTASGSGTFIPRFAQNAHTTGTLTVYKGSHLLVTGMP